MPVNFQDENHTWYGGFGDSALGIKHEIWSSMPAGSIFSVAGEAAFPTGNKARALGMGVTTFETYAAFDQLLPANLFFEFQGGADLPVKTQIAPRSLFWNTVIGENVAQNKGLGRLWSPMVEFLATRDFETGATTD